MVWLVSYPRSGNTFVRNILYHVYGMESSVYHNLPGRKVPDNFSLSPFVKTHLLPGQLPENLQDAPAVYIVRDGRDAIVSEAWHRKNFHAPRSRVRHTMLEAILAHRGTYFGGWSTHVQQWMPKAAVIIRFEDLRTDPIAQVERLRSIIALPEPDIGRLPTFESQKTGAPKYGQVEGSGRNRAFFRKGRAGGWREEMPRWQQHAFWRYHGPVMEAVGYRQDGSLTPDMEWDAAAQMLEALPPWRPEGRMYWENMNLNFTKLGLR